MAQKIAQKDVLERVLKGIDRALEVGLGVKINMVPLKGINDNEIIDIMEYSKSRGIKVDILSIWKIATQ